jgi:hypothetical protein
MDYSYNREGYDISSITKSILSIQISPAGFSFVISPSDFTKSVDYIYIKKLEDANPENLLASLLTFNVFDLKEFYAIRIMVHEGYFALVPESLFDLRDMKAYLSLNHPHRLKCKALSNRINATGAVCVFSMDQTLYFLLKNKFPGADFCHTSLPFCSMALNNKSDGCFVQSYENSLEIAVVMHQKLLLYNIFSIQSENDIVYFILNAYKSLSLDPYSLPLIIGGVLTKNSESVKLAEKYIKSIRFYENPDALLTINGEFEYPSHYFLNHREILSCEL